MVRENILELLEDLQVGDTPTRKQSFQTSIGSSEREALGSATQVGGHSSQPTAVIKTTPTDAIPLEEHLFSSEINKTYTTRLRLKQRIKQFYGLTSKSKLSNLINGKCDSEYRTQGV